MTSLAQVQKFYFNKPKLWESLRLPSVDKEIKFLSKILRQTPNKVVLDVGCGSGVHCQMLQQKGYESWGVDLNSHMIDYARKHYPSCQFLTLDMGKLATSNLKKGYFGAILCLCTTFAYNIKNEEIEAVLRSFQLFLKDQGLLIIELFNPISFFQKLKLENSFFLESQDAYKKRGYRVEVKHAVWELGQIVEETKDFFDLKSGKLLK